MARAKLKPCPFCGSTNVKRLDLWQCVMCLHCGACGPTHYDRRRAVRLWNTRPASKEPKP